MAIFDSIVNQLAGQFGLNNSTAGSLLSGLLGLIVNGNGGLSGFLDLFRNAGHGAAVDSWVKDGDNTPLEPAEVERSLGSSTLDRILGGTGLAKAAALPILGSLIPMVVDKLTPGGVVPSQSSLVSTVGGYLTGSGVSARNAVTPAASDTGSGSFWKWLLPLLLLGLLAVLGFWYCGRSTPTTTNVYANVNANANRVTSTVTNANTSANQTSSANANTSTEASRTLGEVVLPNGTKLQAYPGGIEDQLVKFIGSADYKNATAEQLKEKWFNFDDLNFKVGTTELAPESKRQLDNIMAILKAFPDVKIKIGGYTDKTGDEAANLKLSDGRAKAVQTALQKTGVGAQVPEAEGYGEKFATVDEKASDDARKADRKTAVRLIK